MSHDHRPPTLVMGARGSVGRIVLEGLMRRDLPVRASARRPQPGAFPAGVPAHAADLTDPASLAVAFDGVGQVFLYAHRDGVDGVVHAARTAGIERIVLMSSGSVLNPTAVGNAITEEHRDVERAFADATDLDVVPIRPLVLAGNALGWSSSIRASRSIALYRPDALTAPIHERDIAEVAIAALVGSDSPHLSDMLTGPERSSQRDQVAAIASATGTDIAVTELDRGEALETYSRFMPAHEAEAVLQFLEDADAGNSPATETLPRVLGRPAIPFADWAADHADDFRAPLGRDR